MTIVNFQIDFMAKLHCPSLDQGKYAYTIPMASLWKQRIHVIVTTTVITNPIPSGYPQGVHSAWAPFKEHLACSQLM